MGASLFGGPSAADQHGKLLPIPDIPLVRFGLTEDEVADQQQFRREYQGWRRGCSEGSGAREYGRIPPSPRGRLHVNREMLRAISPRVNSILDFNLVGRHDSIDLADDDEGEAEETKESKEGTKKLAKLLRSGIHLSPQVCQSLCASDVDLLVRSQAVLEKNWIGASTKPAPGLYPHQWSWDSIFIAMGYAHYNPAKAESELLSLLSAQWENGMVPSIVFNPIADAFLSYFPSAPFWRIRNSPFARNLPTTDLSDGQPGCPAGPHGLSTGICQPPVHATGAWHIYTHAKDKKQAKRFLRIIFPKLVKWHEYLHRDRDVGKDGLAYIRHPWENGMDNSPNWDQALQDIDVLIYENPPWSKEKEATKEMKLIPGVIPVYQRRDTLHARADERPTNDFYHKAVYLIKLFYENDYNEEAIARVCPFMMQDVCFNAIYARANKDLAQIAEVIGEDPVPFLKRAEQTNSAINSKMWDGTFYFDINMCRPFDRAPGGYHTDPTTGEVLGAMVKHRTASGFVSFWSAAPTPETSGVLLKDLQSGEFGTMVPVSSTSTWAPEFDACRYWRGPTWLNVNYLIIEGLAAHNNPQAQEVAEEIRDAILDRVKSTGSYEYWNPKDGSPYGAAQFSWTSALSISMVCTGHENMKSKFCRAGSLPSEALDGFQRQISPEDMVHGISSPGFDLKQLELLESNKRSVTTA